MYKTIFFTLLYILSYCSIATAGPFGTNMNDKIDQYNNLKQLSPNRYLTQFLPNSHERFTPYILEFNKNGLHSVTGVGKVHPGDYKCYRISREFGKLKETLTKKYGNPTGIIDDINVGDKSAIHDLASHKPKMSALWDKNLPDNLSKIILVGTVGDTVDGETRCTIMYEYNNYSKEKDDSL